MSAEGYIIYVCLLVVNWVTLHVFPILFMVHEAQNNNYRTVIVMGVMYLVSSLVSICLVWVITMACFINYPQPIEVRRAQGMPALSHE